MVKKRGLGRPLNALLIGASQRKENVLNLEAPTTTSDEEVSFINLDQLQPGQYQPRRDIEPEALEELAESIRAQGVLQPILIRKLATGSFEIIAGERRWRAARLAGLDRIPALVRDIDDETAMAVALIENIQRENLNPVEEALGLQRLIEECGMTHQAVAEAVGRSRAGVSNLLRLLTLEAEVRTLLERGDIEMGHARALLGLSGDAQVDAARSVVARNLSVRETEAWVRKGGEFMAQQVATSAQTKALLPEALLTRQQDLAQRLGAKVVIKPGSKGRGGLLIKYKTIEELDELIERIQ